jgi:3-oxoacyl-[acyl-carrier-protein] synthase III
VILIVFTQFAAVSLHGSIRNTSAPCSRVLDEMNRGRILKAGSLILTCSFGTGVTWGVGQ